MNRERERRKVFVFIDYFQVTHKKKNLLKTKELLIVYRILIYKKKTVNLKDAWIVFFCVFIDGILMLNIKYFL